MLIDLHAHAPLPGYYNQHSHWGPFFEKGDDGDIRLRVGHWILTLGSPERKAAVRAGKAPSLEDQLRGPGPGPTAPTTSAPPPAQAPPDNAPK